LVVAVEAVSEKPDAVVVRAGTVARPAVLVP
jgi:hypothetical protein